MLDLVPLAGAGRQVTDGDRDIEFVGQLLQLQLPQPYPRAVAATTISGDQQAFDRGIALMAHRLPPAPDGVGCESRGVMVDADTDPAGVAGNVVDTIGHGSPEFGNDEVVDAHFFG